MPGDLVAREVARALAARLRIHIRAFGTSMLPWIRPGDLLAIERAHFSQIRAGDVVLYERDGRLFIHRVLRKMLRDARPYLLAKGDAIPRADAPVSEQEFLGRVVSLERAGRVWRLNARGRRALSRVLARVSSTSRYWFPLARAARRLLLPGGLPASSPRTAFPER